MLMAVERRRKRRRKRSIRKIRNTRSIRSIRKRRVEVLYLQMNRKSNLWRKMEIQERSVVFL